MGRLPLPVSVDGDITRLGAALAAGEITASRLVQACLARIAAHDRQGAGIHAMTVLCEDAPAQARRLDEERAAGLVRGPLHGIPIVVKDNIDVAGWATTAGCAVLRDHRPPRDAEVVRRLREAGAIVLGKTNMSELACSNGRYGYSSLGGLTLNPYNRARNAAGSSSGSGAAVAAGYAAAALGTDSFGSVRAPACVAGLAGLRPTHGRVPIDGVLPLALSFDTVGPMARSVRDVALMMNVMADAAPGVAGCDYLDGLRPDALQGARIGVIQDFPGEDEEVRAVTGDAVARLRELGAVLVPLSLPSPSAVSIAESSSGAIAAPSSAATAASSPPAMAALPPAIATLYSALLAPVAEAEWPGQLDAYLAAGVGGGPRAMTQLLAAAQAWSADHPDRAVNPRTLAGMQRALDAARAQTVPAREAARAALAEYRDAVVQSMQRQALAAMVFPTLSCPASPRYDRTDPSYTSYPGNPYAGLYVASAAGLPEISVPAGMARAGVPIGLSFMGGPYDEARLLGLAYAFEQARGPMPAPILD